MKKIKAVKMATGGLMSMPPYIAKQDKTSDGITPYDVNTPMSARKGLPSRALDKSRTRFNKGGEAFPDLSGDGEITQEDILIGKGVIKKAKGGIMQRMKFGAGDISTKELVKMRKMEQLEAMQDEGLPLTDEQEAALEEYKASKNIKAQQMAIGGVVGNESISKYNQRPDYQAYAEGDVVEDEMPDEDMPPMEELKVEEESLLQPMGMDDEMPMDDEEDISDEDLEGMDAIMILQLYQMKKNNY